MSSYFSASRFLKRNNVMTKEPPVTSRAAYVLLIHSYIKSFDLPDWVKWIRFRDEWMEEQFELHGGLVYCPACGKGPLKFSGSGRDVATADHIEPTSLGGPKYDKDNLQILCQGCNNERGNMPYPEFLKKLEKKGKRLLTSCC